MDKPTVTQPRVTDNDKDEITVSLDGQELRGLFMRDSVRLAQGEAPCFTLSFEEDGVFVHVHLLVAFGTARYFTQWFSFRELPTFLAAWGEDCDATARLVFGYTGWDSGRSPPEFVSRPSTTREEVEVDLGF